MEQMRETGCKSDIFPKRTTEEVQELLRKEPKLYEKYQELDGKWKQRFMEYCIGKKTLPITYDPFFKQLFHPDIHRDRLSRLISCILGEEVQVKHGLPTEEHILAGGALLVMDVLVELEDGTLANLEIQKVPYLFPGERMSCYSADLLLRQYSRMKSEKGKAFTYQDIKKVYTIVIFEQSGKSFHKEGLEYLHKGEIKFDTGLELELLQKYCLIALDVFVESGYPKDRYELSGWLSLLGVVDAEEAEKTLEFYPWLKEIYQEMAEYFQRPQEVMEMYSEALLILDQNTAQYMVEEQKQELEEQQKELEEQQKKLEEQQKELEEQNRIIEEERKAKEELEKRVEKERMDREAREEELRTYKEELEALKRKMEEKSI